MKLGLLIKKNAKVALTAVSVVGVIGTAFVARHDAMHEKDIFSKDEPVTKKEKALCYAKAYWKTGLTVAVTSGTIIFSHCFTAKQIAALTAAATFAEEKLRSYRNVVKEKLGEEEEHNIYAESCEKDWSMTPKLPNSEDMGNLEYFYDEFSDRFFQASFERVQQAMYHLNRIFHLRGYAYLSEFYEFLGLEANDLSKTIGWSDAYYLDELELTPWIDFYSQDKTAKNGVTYHTIIYDVEPTVAAMNYYR